jgi:hypothetical protein
MDEWKHGKLHSGSSSGPVVTSRKQAIAIGLSEQRALNAAHRSHPNASRLGKYLHGKKGA